MDLADYINEYNDVCPHKALGYKTPSKVFADYFTGMLAVAGNGCTPGFFVFVDSNKIPHLRVSAENH